MVLLRSQKNKRLRKGLERQVWQEKQRKCLATLLTVAGAFAMRVYPTLVKEPQHTSKLSGQAWMQELLHGHHASFHDAMGMNKHVFRKLLCELPQRTGLGHTRFVSAEEQLGIFLYACRTGLSIAHIKNRFQHSGDTISRVINRSLNLIISEGFYCAYVKLPNDNTPLALEIRNNPKFNPFFEDCDGSIDGTHIDAFVPEDAVARFRNRKGRLSQNVLAVCGFNMQFNYILSGWEGSAADGTVFDDARRTDLAIRPGKYLLADAGFPNCDSLLVPYRGVRYHLKEWGRANQKPKNYQELFNLRHAQARNIVERIFGVVKRRFRLMVLAPQYPIRTQAKFIPAMCALHNFIRIHDPSDFDGVGNHNERVEPARRRTPEEHELGGSISQGERVRASDKRDSIAKAMWESYQQVLGNN